MQEYADFTSSWFPKVTTLSFIFPWYKICPSSLTRPSWLLSRSMGLHAIAPSVSRILKMPLPLLAFRQFPFCFVFTNKVFLTGGLSSAQGWLASFFGSRPGCIEALEAWYFFLVFFFQYIFHETLWRIESNRNKYAPGPNLLLENFRKIITNILNLSWIKPIFSWMETILLYKSCEQWQGSCGGLKPVLHKKRLVGLSRQIISTPKKIVQAFPKKVSLSFEISVIRSLTRSLQSMRFRVPADGTHTHAERRTLQLIYWSGLGAYLLKTG